MNVTSVVSSIPISKLALTSIACIDWMAVRDLQNVIQRLELLDRFVSWIETGVKDFDITGLGFESSPKGCIVYDSGMYVACECNTFEIITVRLRCF